VPASWPRVCNSCTLRARARRMAALLLAKSEELGEIFAERLDCIVLGKLTTVCGAFKNWARGNGRELRLVLQHPMVSRAQVPLPSVWKPLPDGASSQPVPWVLSKHDLHITPIATSTRRPIAGNPPECEAVAWGENSLVDRSRCTVDVDLIHATTKAVEQKLAQCIALNEHPTGPGQMKFQINRLSSKYTPRAMLQIRVVVNVALYGQERTRPYVAYSDPMHVVSKIPTPRSIENSKARSRRRVA